MYVHKLMSFKINLKASCPSKLTFRVLPLTAVENTAVWAHAHKSVPESRRGRVDRIGASMEATAMR